MAVKLSPIGNDAPFLDSSGNPLSGGLLYTYTAGSSTPETTYTTSAGSVANANPIVLNAGGYPAASGSVVSIWLTEGVSYKFTLKTSAGVEVWTRDNVSGINDTAATQSEWVAGPAPTFVSSTQFTLVGDQTTEFHVGRRLRVTDGGGTKYARITVSAFTTVTTVTVEGDALETPTSAVSYGIIRRTDTSLPAVEDDALIIVDPADPTKRVRLDAGSVTAGQTRVITVPDRNLTLVDGPTLGTEQASTSGTAIDFTGIPSWVKKITVQFVGVSTSGTSTWLIQIGDAGDIETTGYSGSSANLVNAAAIDAASSTAGFLLNTSAAASLRHGTVTLYLEDAAAFTWVASGLISESVATAGVVITAGSKSLSAALDRVRITTSGGSDTFDLGAINILYE